MSTKIKTIIVTLVTVLAVGAVPATSHALKAKPTGNAQLDDYCTKAAALIDRALSESALALINGDDEGSRAWDEIAIEMIKRSRARGCEFAGARQIRALRLRLATDVRPGGTEPTVSPGTSSPEPEPEPQPRPEGADAPPVGDMGS
jgi:hypothetical protein